MRYAQLVIGPAGSGKSTYCAAMQEHGENIGRTIEIVNLDPAAEQFDYNPLIDIRELKSVDEAMDDSLQLGPNGGLVYCIEYLIENIDWLQEKLDDLDNDYIIFDCPGQIELYTHLTAIKKLITTLQNWNFNICAIFLLDVQFMTDGTKFLSGTMSALSVMVNLELPHVNLISKMDLLSKSAKKQIDKFLEPDTFALLDNVDTNSAAFNKKYKKLTEAIGRLVEDYSLVRFIPLNLKDEENLGDVLITIDNILQYGEDQDVKTRDFEGNDPED